MGTLVLLALARLFVAPEPSPAPTDATTTPPSATAPTTAPTGDAPITTGDSTPPLLLIDFRPRAGTLDVSPAAYDLRDPFRPTANRASATATGRQRASGTHPDLRDPFAEPLRRLRIPARPAEDLRDPFYVPAPVLPKCPDTGGVPIQRPGTVEAGCAQASRGVVLAHH